MRMFLHFTYKTGKGAKYKMKRNKLDRYKVKLARNLAAEYAKLDESMSEERQALKNRLWELLTPATTESDCDAATDSDNIGRSMAFAYMRAKSKEDDTDWQLQMITEYAAAKNIAIDRVIEEEAYWGDIYQGMKMILRWGDTLIVSDIERLGRNMSQISTEWRELADMGVILHVADEDIFGTANKAEREISVTAEFLSYAANKERAKVQRLQAKGIARAKAAGKYRPGPGRRRKVCENFESVYKRWKANEITVKGIMEELNVSHDTFYRRVREYENR